MEKTKPKQTVNHEDTNTTGNIPTDKPKKAATTDSSKTGHNKKEKPKASFKRVGYQLGLLILISIIGLVLSKFQASRKVAAVKEKGGVEKIVNDLKAYKEVQEASKVDKEYLGISDDESEIVFNFDEPIKNEKSSLKEVAPSQDVAIDMLFQVASKAEKNAFKKELDNVFNIGEHSNFFKRQIDYAKLNIDLSVISGGIINIHRIYEGSHPLIKPKDRGEYIDFIRDSVQNAVASNDMNYKAIVFKSIEATTY